MDTSLENKAFVVTGATSGIGLAATRQLLELGHSVIGIGRSADRCRERHEELAPRAASASHLQMLVADLSLQSEVLRVAQQVRETLAEWRFSHLDGLINNAATVPFW